MHFHITTTGILDRRDHFFCQIWVSIEVCRHLPHLILCLRQLVALLLNSIRLLISRLHLLIVDPVINIVDLPLRMQIPDGYRRKQHHTDTERCQRNQDMT